MQMSNFTHYSVFGEGPHGRINSWRAAANHADQRRTGGSRRLAFPQENAKPRVCRARTPEAGIAGRRLSPGGERKQVQGLRGNCRFKERCAKIAVGRESSHRASLAWRERGAVWRARMSHFLTGLQSGLRWTALSGTFEAGNAMKTVTVCPQANSPVGRIKRATCLVALLPSRPCSRRL